MRGLGAVYSGDFGDRFDMAIELYTKALTGQLRVLGASHPDTLWTQHSLAVSYHSIGSSEEAARLLEHTYEARSRVLGADHLHTLRTKFWLAMTYEHLGKAQEVTQLLEETLADTSRTLGETHADTLRVMHCLGSHYARLGCIDKARTLFKKGLQLRRIAFGDDHPSTIRLKNICEMFENSLKENVEIEAMLAERSVSVQSKELISRDRDSLHETIDWRDDGGEEDGESEFDSLVPLLLCSYKRC